MSDSRRQQRIPSYRLHRPSGRVVVALDGRDHHLGEHGSPESRARYDRLVREYLANDRTLPDPRSDRTYRVGELCRDFVRWAKDEYRLPDGRQAGGVGNVRVALRPLGQLFMDVPVEEFGPRSLMLYRVELITRGLARKTINDKVNIVRRAFKWGVRNELVSPSVLHGLQSVDGLKRGRCGVPESPGRGPAPELSIGKALPFTPSLVQAMVELQILTEMRPGEAVVLRVCDIDQSGVVWLFRPVEHKNSWRGHDRVIPIGPKGQQILGPLLRPGYQERYLFSPEESKRLRREALRDRRKTHSGRATSGPRRASARRRHMGSVIDTPGSRKLSSLDSLSASPPWAGHWLYRRGQRVLLC